METKDLGTHSPTCIATPLVVRQTHVDRIVDVKGAEKSVHDAIKEICKDVVTGWNEYDDSLLGVSTITGGITNCLYKVWCLDDADEACLVRAFGEKTELLIDREKDNKLFAVLSDVGFGPHFHGTFTNGRVEGFMPSRPLQPSEMAARSPVDMVRLIARETAKMHALELGPVGQPILWPTLDKFHSMMLEVRFDPDSSDPVERGKAESLACLGTHAIGDELQWLKTVLPSSHNSHGSDLLRAMAESSRASSSSCTSCVASYESSLGRDTVPQLQPLCIPTVDDPVLQARIDGAAVAFRVVFAHNDLLSGNILLLSRPDAGPDAAPSDDDQFSSYRADRVAIIDYEYGGYNYAGFDFGNHWCEHAGFDFDLDRWYPSHDTQKAWLTSYLHRLGLTPPRRPGSEADDDVTAAFFDEAVRQSNRFALASHLWWGQWAVIQSRHSPIDFDFMGYAKLRMDGYRKHKKMYFAMEA